jgi:FlaA1/EpsC-like NDP-sugar epimerase
MSIEEAIELVQKLQSCKNMVTYEQYLLDMAEAALVDLLNYQGDGPRSKNVEREVKNIWGKL